MTAIVPPSPAILNGPSDAVRDAIPRPLDDESESARALRPPTRHSLNLLADTPG
ncbi:b56.2 [miniopterid betaherpesvirus 1]|uniref:B56.2 n=1 Tax=miniopterid betaherpesvirus 1 TaxID=3070189 RepID=I3VQ45_9BETA|nr:b56.2 [miniopterid betaherpesvirus 1]AFK83889.1 b56.2 [miniopterid betaherpesvirus 1]